jgi:hypothetical protein
VDDRFAGPIAFCGSGALLNVTVTDDTILEARFWNLATRQTSRRAVLQLARAAPIYHSAVADDCSAVAAVHGDGSLELWKVSDALSAAMPAPGAVTDTEERKVVARLIESESSSRLAPYNGDWRAMLTLRAGGTADDYASLYQLAFARKTLAGRGCPIDAFSARTTSAPVREKGKVRRLHGRYDRGVRARRGRSVALDKHVLPRRLRPLACSCFPLDGHILTIKMRDDIVNVVSWTNPTPAPTSFRARSTC